MSVIGRLQNSARASLLLASALCLVLLTSCSSRRVRETSACKGVDWWEAGRTNGVAGLPLDESLKDTRTRCQDHVDLEAFENGHEAGLVDFCTPAQGFALGRSGLAYEKACPSYLEGPFLQQYEAGLKLRSLETERTEAHIEKSSKTL